MTPWLYALMASGAAVSAEFYYRLNPDKSWGIQLWPGVLLALAVNYGIWGLTRTQSLVELAILFSLFTAGFRVVITLYRGEVVTPGVWIAFGLVVLASLVRGLWK